MEKENILKPNIITEESEFKKNASRIIKGSLLAILISLILLFIYAMMLTYTEVSESTMIPVVLVIAGISILIGSMISARKIRKNGLLNGAIVGFVYILILYITSSLCLVGFSITSDSITMMVVGIITGTIGGIIGVNLNRK